MVESVPKSVLAAVFPIMIRLPVRVKLAKTVDYETTKRLIVTVRVTDANSHTFSKNFTFTITDPNSNNNSPTDTEGVSSLTLAMLKVKVLSKVFKLTSVTLTVILRFLVVS
jgi:hypothetical protein